MLVRLMVLFVVLALALPALAEEELITGVEKGQSSTTVVGKNEVTFKKGKRVVLVLKDSAATTWRKFKTQLGPAFVSEPVWSVKNDVGKPGKIYRFLGGVLVEHGRDVFFMTWPIAANWWPESGFTRVK